MKRLVLKESKAVYSVQIDDTAFADEVVLLEKEGQPVAAVLPISEYRAYQLWRDAENRTQSRQTKEAEIEREHAAFAKMLPELIKQYSGQVVAIYNGKVVATGSEKMDVWEQARLKIGKQTIYVQKVAKAPTIYKMPNRRVVTDVGI